MIDKRYSNTNTVSYTIYGVSYPSNNLTYYNKKDIYDTEELALNRAFNIGCSGYRRFLSNANGDYKYSPCSDANDYKNIMKTLSKTTVNRRYYDSDPRENLYDVRDSINDNLYEGFDYKEEILKKSLSNLFYKDPIKESILNYINRIVFGLVETTKQIKNFVNYTVKKNNRRVF